MRCKPDDSPLAFDHSHKTLRQVLEPFPWFEDAIPQQAYHWYSFLQPQRLQPDDVLLWCVLEHEQCSKSPFS